MTTPRFSVVMPVFNEEAVIERALRSVLNQSYADLELIVVDDASTDGSAEVVTRLMTLDPRIRLLRTECNSRASTSPWECRNDALRQARGDLIAYLDADNEWRPLYLERMLAVFDADPDVVLAVARSCNWHAHEAIDSHIAADKRTYSERGPDWVIYGFDAIDPAELGFRQYIDTNEMVHRMRVFDVLGEFWRTRHPRAAEINRNLGCYSPWRRHNDLDLAERIISAFGVDRTALVPEVLVDYFYAGARRDPQLTASVPFEGGDG